MKQLINSKGREVSWQYRDKRPYVYCPNCDHRWFHDFFPECWKCKGYNIDFSDYRCNEMIDGVVISSRPAMLEDFWR